MSAPLPRSGGPSRLVVRVDRHQVIHAAGEIDAETAPVLAATLTTHAQPASTRVDLCGITFMSGDGIRALRAPIDARATDRLLILRPSIPVLRVLAITGTLRHMDGNVVEWMPKGERALPEERPGRHPRGTTREGLRISRARPRDLGGHPDHRDACVCARHPRRPRATG